jgi:hypothetical protein
MSLSNYEFSNYEFSNYEFVKLWVCQSTSLSNYGLVKLIIRLVEGVLPFSQTVGSLLRTSGLQSRMGKWYDQSFTNGFRELPIQPTRALPFCKFVWCSNHLFVCLSYQCQFFELSCLTVCVSIYLSSWLPVYQSTYSFI